MNCYSVGMFRIGEFSRITKVTIETLRHYDTPGLLKPVKVDSLTGYHYYSARQLLLFNRILSLKEAGAHRLHPQVPHYPHIIPCGNAMLRDWQPFRCAA